MLLKRLLGVVFAGLALTLGANDDDANRHFESALKLEDTKEFIAAGEEFANAELMADSPDLKLKAAQRTVEAYRKAGHRYKEFTAIERLIRCYPTLVGFAALVDREFAIGDEYFHGYRDPAFWSLRFIPWLTDKTKEVEIYETAIKHAPFAKRAGSARLRLAVYYLSKVENTKAIKLLREVIQYYPNTEESRFAILELGNALFEMAKRGDGDGRDYDEAMAVFREFKEKYPEQSENEWVARCMLMAKDTYAERLYGIAEYYERNGRTRPAELYLLEVLRRFPESTVAPKSEALLAKLDRTFFPERIELDVPERFPTYQTFPFPEEDRRLLIAPENSHNKYLLPIRSLNLTKPEK